MEFSKRYLTRDSLYHLAMVLPAVILLVVYGVSLVGQWWFYTLLFVLNILSVVVNVAGVILAAEQLLPKVYPVVRMLSFLLFIPAFCGVVLAVFFAIFGLFGIDFMPNT